MASELVTHALSALAGTIPSLTALVATWRKRLKELDGLKFQVATLEREMRERKEVDVTLEAGFDQRVRNVYRGLIGRTSVADATATKQLVIDALRPLHRDLERLEVEVKAATQLAASCARESEFADHVTAEAERWAEVHRALGQIEGMLEGVRDRMRNR